MEPQRKDRERQEEEEVTEELKRFMVLGNGKGVFFICRGTVGV